MRLNSSQTNIEIFFLLIECEFFWRFEKLEKRKEEYL